MMRMEGDHDVLSDLMARQRRGGDTNQTDEFKFGLITGSGLNQGARGSGCMEALCASGVDQFINVMVGISTGGPPIAFLRGGNPEECSAIYSGPCTGPEFMDLKRRGEGIFVVDIKVLESEFERRLNKKAERRHPAEFYLVLKEFKRAGRVFEEHGVVLYRMTDDTNIVHALCAVVAMPKLTKGIVSVGDRYFGDAHPAHPIGDIVSEKGLTHLIVVLNNESPDIMAEIQDVRRRTGCRIAVITGRNPVKPFSQKQGDILDLIQEGREFTAGLIRECAVCG